MAFKFNAILAFNWDQAKGELKKAESEFKSFKDGVQKANESLRNVRNGMVAGAATLAPLTAGVGWATKTAADFEQAMSNVQAVLLATKEEMAPLEREAKALGAATVFTSKDAAEAARFLAMAGFTMKETVAALPGVLDAAAASGMDLATAARIVSSNVRAFGLDASKAGEIADALALTSTTTNTDMLELGEGMKFAAAAAAGAGMSVQSTASALGILANAGIRGSLGGTALKNALIQLAKPSKDVLNLFGGQAGLNEAVMEFRDGAVRLRPMEVIMANISKVVAKAPNPLKAAGEAAEIFGIRGATAFQAFQTQLLDTTQVTDRNIETIRRGIEKTGERIQVKVGDTIPKLVALRLQIAGASGTASQMAKIRLDNFLGSIEYLSSAVEALGLEIGGMLLGPLNDVTSAASDFMSVVSIAFQVARQGVAMTNEQMVLLQDNRFKGLLGAALEFAKGFVEGFNELKATVISVFETIAGWMKPFGLQAEMNAKSLGKMAAKIVFIGAALGPILAGAAAFFFAMGPIISGITGFFGLIGSMWTMISSGFSAALGAVDAIALALGAPALAVVGIIAAIIGAVAAVYIFRNEIAAAAKSAYQGIVRFFTDPLSFSFQELGKRFGGVGQFIGAAMDVILTPAKIIVKTFQVAADSIKGGFFDIIKMSFGDIGARMGTFGKIVGMVIDGITMPMRFTIAFFTTAARAIFDVFVQPMINWFKSIASAVEPILEKINEKFGQFMGIVNAIINSPVGQQVSGFVSFMADGMRSVMGDMADWVLSHFDQGFRGLLTGMKIAAGGIASTLKILLIDPFVNMFTNIRDMLGKIISFIPESMLAKIGLSNAQLQQFLGTDFGVKPSPGAAPTVQPPLALGSTLNTVQDSAQIANETLKQKSLVQPPSAGDVVEAARAAGPRVNSDSQGGSGGGQQTVKVVVEGRIRGNDLNLIQTKAAISQSERNGLMLDPDFKRRLMQNGAPIRQ